MCGVNTSSGRLESSVSGALQALTAVFDCVLCWTVLCCVLTANNAGNGSSVTAVKGGLSVDTSMGLTPLEG